MIETFNHLLYSLFNGMWFVVVLSFVIALATEHEAVWQAYEDGFKPKGKPVTILRPVFRRLIYVALGVLLVNGSYALIAFISSKFTINENTGIPVATQARMFMGAVSLLIVSGYSLSLSVGNRWMVNLSKLLATAAFLLTMALVILSYIY